MELLPFPLVLAKYKPHIGVVFASISVVFIYFTPA